MSVSLIVFTHRKDDHPRCAPGARLSYACLFVFFSFWPDVIPPATYRQVLPLLWSTLSVNSPNSSRRAKVPRMQAYRLSSFSRCLVPFACPGPTQLGFSMDRSKAHFPRSMVSSSSSVRHPAPLHSFVRFSLGEFYVLVSCCVEYPRLNSPDLFPRFFFKRSLFWHSFCPITDRIFKFSFCTQPRPPV